MEKRTSRMQIKKGHKLYPYFFEMCTNSKNMYNVTNFHIRQVYTALKSDKPLKSLQTDTLSFIKRNIDKMNDNQLIAYQNNLLKEKAKPKDKQKEVKLNTFTLPNNEKAFLSYNFLDCLFKVTNNIDYNSLPKQSSQGIMRKVYDDWKSFFEAIKDYHQNPDKYSGKPKIPNYQKGLKEVYFTNQDCEFKEKKYLKFPKTKIRLNVGKVSTIGKLKQVRVIPKRNLFVVEVVMDVNVKKEAKINKNNIMAIDPGVANLATIVTNTGMKPVIINGNPLKSINQYYNKQRAFYYSQLRKGKQPDEGEFSSKRLEKLDFDRYNKSMDYFHKASRKIIELAVKEQISTIVIGRNKNWKQGIKMHKKTKQHFAFLSHAVFYEMIIYKAAEYGIKVKLQEESYTSKASFIDNDPIPTYGDKHIPNFSGRRINRGLYKTKNGIVINADVNGAYNILRKAFPGLCKGIGVVVNRPRKIRVA